MPASHVEGGGSGPVVQSIGAATDRFGYADATTMAKLVSKGLPVKPAAEYYTNEFFDCK